jgi:hypothetical protein
MGEAAWRDDAFAIVDQQQPLDALPPAPARLIRLTKSYFPK